MSSILEQVDVLIQTLYHEQTHVHVDTSISTNSELIESIKQGTLSLGQVHVLTADRQTAGRGQGSRSWQSPQGNVYLSLFYPTQHRQYPLTQPISGLLSLCVGYFLAELAIIQQINEYRQAKNLPKIGVKWANDIGFYHDQTIDRVDIVDRKDRQNRKNRQEKTRIDFSPSWQASKRCIEFRKLSGILIEPVIEGGKMLGVVVGVGINVQTAPSLTTQTQEGMSYQSVSLAELAVGHQCPSASSLYQPINQAILQAILTHQKVATSEALLHQFLSDFAKLDILRGQQLMVSQLKTSQEESAKIGKAVGIDKFGCLQLQDDDGKVQSLFTGKIDVID